jgi:hypothetical protein
MRCYLKLDTQGNDALHSEILGYTEADAREAAALEQQRRPQPSEPAANAWDAQQPALQMAIAGKLSVAVASHYLSCGLGVVRGLHLVEDPDARVRGTCSGDLAIRILESQREYYAESAPHYDPFIAKLRAGIKDALDRAIAAARDGRLPGVCWN